MTKMAAMPIYGKNMKDTPSLEPKGRWPWKLIYIIGYLCTTEFIQMMTGLTMTYFMARSNFVPYAFVWEDGNTMDFSEIIVVYDIRIGRCSQLNENMKPMSTKGQGHSLILVQIAQFQYLKLHFVHNH